MTEDDRIRGKALILASEQPQLVVAAPEMADLLDRWRNVRGRGLVADTDALLARIRGAEVGT